MPKNKIGPNVKKLIIHKMTFLMIPPNSPYPWELGMEQLTYPGNISQTAKQAEIWVKSALKVIRLAKDPNPWKNASDEAIAGHLLIEIEKSPKNLTSLEFPVKH